VREIGERLPRKYGFRPRFELLTFGIGNWIAKFDISCNIYEVTELISVHVPIKEN
jgi:hypothetical protein